MSKNSTELKTRRAQLMSELNVYISSLNAGILTPYERKRAKDISDQLEKIDAKLAKIQPYSDPLEGCTAEQIRAIYNGEIPMSKKNKKTPKSLKAMRKAADNYVRTAEDEAFTRRVIRNSPAQASEDLHLIVSKVLISARRA